MNLRKFNNLLSIVVILFGFYIAVTPFLPEVTRWFKDKSPEASAPYSGELAEIIGSSSSTAKPSENRLVIPSIQVDEPILESSNIGIINDGGTWRRPQSSIPTENSNTVIVGHRFFGNEVSTFYHLDKVSVGQKLALYWDGEEIIYEVAEVKIVLATAIEIEAPTDNKRLTIYTCNPIWTAKDRLVVVAKPIGLEI